MIISRNDAMRDIMKNRKRRDNIVRTPAVSILERSIFLR